MTDIKVKCSACGHFTKITDSEINRVYQQGKADAIEEYKGKMLSRLIPHLNDIECAKNSETYLAITEIAEQLKENNNA